MIRCFEIQKHNKQLEKIARKWTSYSFGGLPRKALATSEITNRTRKTKKIILAISAAAPAIPPNPSIPAIIATIKKLSAQPNIPDSFFVFMRKARNGYL
jgi:hypothetical protein